MDKESGLIQRKPRVLYSSDDDESYYSDDSADEDQGPKQKLLVLPLGGFLCARVYKKSKTKVRIPRNRQPDGDFEKFYVYKRPYCEDFVKFCLERFEVGIWSSASGWNTEETLECVIGGLENKLLFTWDQRKCTGPMYQSFLENKNKTLFLKDLSTLLVFLRIDGIDYKPSEALLIETDPYKSFLNPPDTSIFLDEYSVKNVSDDKLGPDGKLRKYLDNLSKAEDVPSFVKANPFGNPAITSSHPHWSSCSEMIRIYGD
ncbi:unnamed protein product [Linum tenue]|uniref:Mitochondrial import inner membrane translocase subunit TIM50 n=1 Tax=Linum tenue TaxID=586396 RepID=A0AAV0P255_9ROSI|nr:unnamed protein product [Linum tenue]